MTEKNKKSTKDKITKLSLLQEIEPLIKEYFIAEISLTDEKIKLSFENGQKFEITAQEII